MTELVFLLHLTICPGHILTSRACTSERHICTEEVCIEHIRAARPTSAYWILIKE